MTQIYRSCSRASAISLLVLGLALTLPAGAVDYSAPGPFSAGWRDITVTRPDSTTFAAAVYYPALTPGSGTPLDAGGAPYPAISFGHGYLMTIDKYQSTLEHLASWGFIVVASRSAANFFPSHQAFANDMSQCLTQLGIESANTGSWLFGAVDMNHCGMSGHSMGGGCSILATSADPRVRILANMAAAETNPSAIAAMAAIHVPVLLICGSEDGIVPVQNHGQRMYDNGDSPRQLPLLLGGSHCGFMDFNVPFCDSGSMPRELQLSLTRRLLAATFCLYLKNDQSAWRTIWGPEAFSDNNIVVQSDPGISLSAASATIDACPGATAEFSLTVGNTRALADSFALQSEDNDWIAALTPAQSALLSPGQTSAVVAQMTAPAGPGPVADTWLVSARSGIDGGTRAWVALTTRRSTIAGDLDLNGTVDLSDLSLILSNYGAVGAPETGDLDNNGVVDLADLSILLSNYGTGC